jgi:hypothetical protein
MNPHEHSDKLDALIADAIVKYDRAIIRVQNKLHDDILLQLKNLELDSEGYIKQNSANRKILRRTQEQFDETISSSGYKTALENYLSVIPEINTLNELYFKSIESTFTPNRNYLRSLQTQTINNLNQLILQDGLQAQVRIPLNQILEQNVSSGGSYSGMLQQVRNFVIGGENEGQLLKYVRTYTTDALFSYSRSYMEAVTSDLKLDWYVYSGGTIDKTREFCDERTGRFFHRKEIESWANLEWRGKRPGTTKSSIFVFLGGWNCRHQLIPVSDSVVPKIDLDRLL